MTSINIAVIDQDQMESYHQFCFSDTAEAKLMVEQIMQIQRMAVSDLRMRENVQTLAEAAVKKGLLDKFLHPPKQQYVSRIATELLEYYDTQRAPI